MRGRTYDIPTAIFGELLLLNGIDPRRAFVEPLTSEVRFDGRGMELVFRPELRPAVAALAAPAVAVEHPTIERDAHGRWT